MHKGPTAGSTKCAQERSFTAKSDRIYEKQLLRQWIAFAAPTCTPSPLDQARCGRVTFSACCFQRHLQNSRWTVRCGWQCPRSTETHLESAGYGTQILNSRTA